MKVKKEKLVEIKDKVNKLLLSVDRPGMKELVSYLNKQTDFFTAPASSKFHLCIEGGLLLHSWHVYNLLIEKNCGEISKDSIIIVALLHDMCKIGLYDKQVNGEYKVNQELYNRGHAKVSLERVQHFIKLTNEEMNAIKYHMGMFGLTHNPEYTFQQWYEVSCELRLVPLLHHADVEASYYEEKGRPITEYQKIVNDKDRTFDSKEWIKIYCDKCGKQMLCPDCNSYVWLNIKAEIDKHEK